MVNDSTKHDAERANERGLGVRLLSDVIERLQRPDPIVLDTSVKQVLAGMAGTALNRLGAVRELVEIGALPEAAILVRSLIELEISAAFILFADEQGREERARRFLAFEVRQRNELLDRVLEVKAQETFVGKGTVAERRLDDLRAAFAKACDEFEGLEKSNNWSGLSYAKMIAAVSNAEAQEPLKFSYRHIYFPFSDYAHPTPIAIRHVLPKLPEDVEPVLLPYGVPLYAVMAATTLCGYAAQVAGATFRDTSDLVERFARAMPQPLR